MRERKKLYLDEIVVGFRDNDYALKSLFCHIDEGDI